MKEHTHCAHCKTNLHLPMTHLHFTRRSPFSRQKSSLNGPDTAWAEGRYNTHPQHHCRSRGACTAHIVHKWSPHSRYNQAWPPCDPSAALAAHTRSMIAFGLQSFARLQSSAQPPCLLSLSSTTVTGGSSLALCLISLAYHHGACLLAGFQAFSSPWPREAGR